EPHGPLLHLRPHDNILAVAIQRDGKIVLAGSVGSEDNVVRVWDAATGKLLIPPLKHRRPNNGVVYGPDGKTIVTCSELGTTVRLWDAATGEPLGLPVQHVSQVKAVALSPDGKIILTGSRDGTARLWDAATG